MTALKHESEFLKDVLSHTLQQALKDLDKPYQNFFAGHTRSRGASATATASRTPSSSP